MHQLLDRVDPPTAVIMANDLASFGAMNALNKRGIVPGKDISVTGIGIFRHSTHVECCCLLERSSILVVLLKNTILIF